MDPNERWEAFLRSFRHDDDPTCRACCEELLAWLAGDGSPPRIVGIAGLDHVIAHAVCTAYLGTPRQGAPSP
jgi:hypothetical protein